MTTNIRQMAALLQNFGRNGDDFLAHINRDEAQLLNAVTDGGSINPFTGMPEFNIGAFEGEGGYTGEGRGGSPSSNPGGQSGGAGGGGYFDRTGGYSMTGMDDSDMNVNVDPANLGMFERGGIGGIPQGPNRDRFSPERQSGGFLRALATFLTAPIETVANIFGIDPEFTGDDVFMGDFSRMMAGLPDAQQPAGSIEANPGAIAGGLVAGPLGALVGGLVSPTFNTADGSHGGLMAALDQATSPSLATQANSVNNNANLAEGIQAELADLGAAFNQSGVHQGSER